MRSFYLLLSNVLPTALILTSATFAAAQSSQPSSSPGPSSTTAPPAAAQSSLPNNSSTATPNGSAPATVNTLGAPIQVTPTNGTAVQGTSVEPDAAVANPIMKRIQRARALAAAHQLQQAAVDLENIRASVNDVALRNVTSLMLIGVYLEEGNYGRSQALLEEAFAARTSQKDESLRTYFAMAGQTVIGIRSHLSRYRSFGLNPNETDLPVEANTDLERVRELLERLAAQAKEISNDAARSYDAGALLEDVVGIRLSLASTNEDREKWQAEYSVVRERLALSQSQTTSLGRSSLLDAVTAKIPNPFATKPTNQADSATSDNSSATPPPSPSATAAGAPASTEKASDPQLISTGSLSGRESKRVTPIYPSTARSAKVSGMVRVFAIVDENGKVWVTNSEGPSLLRRAAEDAAKNWMFPPTLVSGRPVRVAGYLDFDFKM